MKLRTGFVSNSSSSSFVIVTTEENYNKAITKLGELYKEVAEVVATRKKMFGKDCIVLAGFTGNMDSWECKHLSQALQDKLDQEDIGCEDMLIELSEVLREDKDNYFENYENC